MSVAVLFPTPAQDEASRRGEATRLRALVADCVAAGVGRRALLVRLARLPHNFARARRLREARAALEPLAEADRGGVFRLPGGDLVAVWRGEASAALVAVQTALERILVVPGERLPPFLELVEALELPEEAETLLDVVDASLRRDEVEVARADPLAPLDPPLLASLEAALAQADISCFVRRRPVCARRVEGGFRLCWEMRTLSVPDLTATLVPERSVRADPWLFRRLTRTLDRRMLALLAAPQELRGAVPFGINLNIAALLSPEFLHFDAALPASLRGRVVLGMMPTDAMSDPANFLFARDFARARGYRLAMQGMTPDLLDLLPLERIGLDLVGLRYSADLARRGTKLHLPDPDCVILGRADTPEALAWGRAHGIAFYQGRAAPPGAAPPARE